MDRGQDAQDRRRWLLSTRPGFGLEYWLSRRAAQRGGTRGALDPLPLLDGWVDRSRAIAERAERLRVRNAELMSGDTADD